tara:strand:+ start:4496 stop:4843 length:348 start_codon:yes stop_codon:yes gene_type:complete
MDKQFPRLTEPGVSYFLHETLKQHNQSKQYYNTTVFNIILFIIFIGIISSVLIYKKNTKLTTEEKKEKELQKKTYILTKIKQVNEMHQNKYNKMITNLPKMESEFEKLHKNYYNI